MAETPTVSVKNYYKAYKSLFGAIAAAFGAIPLLSEVLPERWWVSYLFPPIDDSFRLLAVVPNILVTVVIYGLSERPFSRSRRLRTRVQWILLSVTVVGACLFLVSRTLFVRTIERPTVGDSVTISVGYERTPFASDTFGDTNDYEMLRQRGQTEEEIRRLWTSQSIITARLALFLSYLLFLMPAIGVCGLQVLYGLLGPATDE